MHENPYAAPEATASPPTPGQRATRPPVVTWKVIVRWTAVCCLSAAPSFVLGILLDGTDPASIVGMVLGILCFVVVYCIAEHTSLVQQALQRRDFRWTARIGYGTRIGISILFPVGFYLDVFAGFFSVGASQYLFRLFNNQLAAGEFQMAGFVPHFVTTLIHGSVVNVILFAYMLIVWGIVRTSVGPPTQDELANR